MSYDVSLVVNAGGPRPVDLALLDVNYTYNRGPMLPAAVGVHLSDMDGWEASRVAELLGRAIEDMTVNPAKYEAMNPPNGWGDAQGWRTFLQTIRDACVLAPLAVLDVH